MSRSEFACLVIGFDFLENALGYHGADREEQVPDIPAPSETDGEQPPAQRPTPHSS
jgi:hypothetical protein